jgi:hypothetical protein
VKFIESYINYLIQGKNKMIDINNLTLKQIKEIQNLTCNSVKDEKNKYVIVRTYSAGVFAGELESRNGREVVMKNARRLWKWSGAASLSQLAMEGVKYPNDCMFPCEVDRVELLEVIEILDCTEKAKESIKSVKIWEK